MKRNLLVSLLLLLSLFSCQKEDLLITNPRFSMASVDMNDSRGVLLSSIIYDLGTEDILEYGFVFGPEDFPTIEKSEVVKERGKPEIKFQMMANFSLTRGEKYFVAAFIKTVSGVTYSLPVDFVSQGSEGFVIEKIEVPPSAYFGDTITVFGRNLSRFPGNYRAHIQDEEAMVTGVSDSSFQLIIPQMLRFLPPYGGQESVKYSFLISGKKMELIRPLKMKEPEFFIDGVQEVAYADDFLIRGDFLRTEPRSVDLLEEVDYNLTQRMSSVLSDTILLWSPLANFPSLNPSFKIFIRGKAYVIEDVFRLKPTELELGREFFINQYNRVTIEGSNFNPTSRRVNRFFVDHPEVTYEVLSVEENRATLHFRYSGEDSIVKFKVYAHLAGNLSRNHFDVTFYTGN